MHPFKVSELVKDTTVTITIPLELCAKMSGILHKLQEGTQSNGSNIERTVDTFAEVLQEQGSKALQKVISHSGRREWISAIVSDIESMLESRDRFEKKERN